MTSHSPYSKLGSTQSACRLLTMLSLTSLWLLMAGCLDFQSLPTKALWPQPKLLHASHTCGGCWSQALHQLTPLHDEQCKWVHLYRATIGESLTAVTQQLREAEAQNKHLVELEADLQRREDMFERQVTPAHTAFHRSTKVCC